MSTKEIVDFIEEKRKTCNKSLHDWLEKGEITRESYQELTLFNEQLAGLLKTTFIKGESLVKEGVVDNLSRLLTYERRPRNTEEAFEVMKRLVLEGSENPYIRTFASRLAERASEKREIPVAVPPVHRLYQGFVETDDIKGTNAFINHCEKVSRDIYEFVKARMVYVSDPPDDYYQPAYHTLEILNLRGDCDDFAILLCSLLRSIGYRTFLGFQQQHVFAGVVLARPCFSTTVQNTEKGKIPMRYVEVPIDPQLEESEIRLGNQAIFFNVFDVLSGEFLAKLVRLIEQVGSMSEEAERKLSSALKEISDRLSEISSAKVFFVDPMMQTMKIADALRDDVSKLTKSEA